VIMALVMTLVPIPIAGPIIAICLARAGRQEIRRTGQTGDAIAVAALWLGVIELLWTAVMLLAALLFASAIINRITHRTTTAALPAAPPIPTLPQIANSPGTFTQDQAIGDAAARGWTCSSDASIWDQSASLNAFACIAAGANTGHQRVWFYRSSGFLGYDTSDDSGGIILSGRESGPDTINVTYAIWTDPNAPMVSPTAQVKVTYRLEAENRVVPLQPIPASNVRR
jgi:hypothetical protein